MDPKERGSKSQRLSDRFVRTVKPKTNVQDFYDSEVSGGSLVLRLYPSGKKTYFLRYRTPGGTRRRFKLGDANGLLLSDARKLARKTIAQVDSGKDPQGERERRRDALTFRNITDIYLERHARRNKKLSSIEKDEQSLRKDLLPAWGSRKAEDIRRSDIIRLLESIAVGRKAPVQANRVQALVHKIFSFACEEQLLESNPVSGLRKRAKETPRDRYLDDDEIKTFFSVLKSREDRHMAAIFALILITGQRPGLVTSMEHSELREDVWIIPAIKVKHRRQTDGPHRIPLTPFALTVIEEAKRYSLTLQTATGSTHDKFSKYLFPSPTTDSHIIWINKACRELFKDMKVEPFTPHDLRRTTSTGMEELGISSDAIDAIQAHAKGGISRVYQHGERRNEIRSALDRWARHLERLRDGREEKKVVNIR